jgi:uracil phosphoribosyltransferase
MPLHILDHPLARHFISQLRDVRTDPQQFRVLCNQVTTILAIEATRDLPLRPQPIQTPLEPMEAAMLAKPVVVVAILRAGMGMVDRVVQLLPEVSVGYIGMERNEVTAEARLYYCKLPELRGRRVLVVDPMLATGGSAEQTIAEVIAAGGDDIRFLCIVAAPEGVARLHARWPDLVIHAGSLDRELDARKYILPGLGDFGDRLFGTL